MNNTNRLFQSLLISKLTLLLGMACYGSPKERVQAQTHLKTELVVTHPLLDHQNIKSICSWLGLAECTNLLLPDESVLSYTPNLDELQEEFLIKDAPSFNHFLRNAEDILTELYVYGHAALIANPSMRRRCRVAANYYIDHCGSHPLLFRHARMSLSISVTDINRWFPHKGWIFQMSDPENKKIKMAMSRHINLKQRRGKWGSLYQV